MAGKVVSQEPLACKGHVTDEAGLNPQLTSLRVPHPVCYMDFGPALGWQELQPGLGVATNTLGSGEHDPESWTSGFLFNYDPAHHRVSVLIRKKG